MESLLQTLVTNVLNVTHWTREAQEQDNDAVLNIRSLLHTAGLDGVGGTTELVSHHILLCPCTGQRISDQRSTLKTNVTKVFGISSAHMTLAKSRGQQSRDPWVRVNLELKVDFGCPQTGGHCI